MIHSSFGTCTSSKKTLVKIFICSSVIFLSASIFGPYEWHIYSVEGLWYFFLVNVLFCAGLFSGVVVPERRIKLKFCFNLTMTQQKIVLLFSILSIISFIYCFGSIFAFYGDDYVFLGGLYNERDASRSSVDKIATVIMQFGTAAYIVDKSFGTVRTKTERVIIAIGLWTSGIYYLAIGNRFTLAVEFFIFAFFWLSAATKNGTLRNLFKSKKIIVLILLGVVILVAFLVLFSTRPHTAAPVRYEFVQGDMKLKPLYQDLYESTNGAVSPLYLLGDYMGESPYIFSYMWDHCIPDEAYWFVNTLRPVVQFASIFGLPSYLDIITEIGSPAKYSGIVFPLVVDFGIYFAPIAAFGFGFIFSEIESLKDRNAACRALYPCCVVCCIFAPVYFFTVGRMDFIVFSIMILLFLLWVAKPLSAQKAELKLTLNGK